MFYNYKILTVNNEEILYLYVNSIYEFSSELDQKHKNTSLLNKVRDYIKIMNINFSGKKIMLVLNGIIIANLVLINNNFNSINNDDNDTLYHEEIDMDKNDNVDIIDVFTDVVQDTKEDNNQYTISRFVKLKNNNGPPTYVEFDNYITNRLSRMIPPTYENEALKAMAVIARTETLKELYENNYINDNNYRSIMTLKKMWNKNFNKYFNKLKYAVIETQNEYLSHNNYYFSFNLRRKYQIPFSGYDANRLAKNGYNYIKILGHYYPDASLEIV